MKWHHVLIAFLLVVATNLQAQARNDFDGDGISDITYMIQSGSELEWHRINSSNSEDVDMTPGISFGLSSDKVAIAHWADESKPMIALIRFVGRVINWRFLLDDFSAYVEDFGARASLVLSGADFDGDGKADAAYVKKGKTSYIWYIKNNFYLDPSGKVKTVSFGNLSAGKIDADRLFYFRADGQTDSLAAFGFCRTNVKKACLSFMKASEKKPHVKSNFPIRLSKGREARPRPFPIRAEDGTDNIGFAVTDASDTTFYVYSKTGKLLRKKTLLKQGTIVVGNYIDDEPGEEILMQTSSGIQIYNPLSNVRTDHANVSGTIVGEVNLYIPTK